MEWWLNPYLWFYGILFGIIPIIFTIWLIARICTGWGTKSTLNRTPPRPADGTDGISAAHGSDASYFPAQRTSEKGGLPVSGIGGGRGEFGRPRTEKRNEDW
jgi:hypothetical protein